MTLSNWVGVGWTIIAACHIFGVMPPVDINDVAGLVCISISYQLLK